PPSRPSAPRSRSPGSSCSPPLHGWRSRRPVSPSRRSRPRATTSRPAIWKTSTTTSDRAAPTVSGHADRSRPLTSCSTGSSAHARGSRGVWRPRASSARWAPSWPSPEGPGRAGAPGPSRWAARLALVLVVVLVLRGLGYADRVHTTLLLASALALAAGVLAGASTVLPSPAGVVVPAAVAIAAAVVVAATVLP